MSTDPEPVLRVLNRRLLGRGDAQATCPALRIGKDGEATLANAGHLPPYLNGEPMAMEGALPLGMIASADFSATQFPLRDGDKLALISEGIAEATAPDGALFGFDRVHELLRIATTAAEVAASAQDFGQEDDSGVIFVTRKPALAPALI
ncbi:MAG TPA: SpoIIE family protein phosphatase [Terracidiphilus sp.]|nr:SpoIIE family protein phosphatase [Terracidiphilus sp.]